MRGVNKVIIVGNLGADPEARQFSNGGSVTNISVATSEQWTDKQTGERKENTEWHRISLFNRLGEIAAQYLRKGSSVYIEGSLRTRKYQDQNGQDRYITEIRADNMQMLSASGGNAGGMNPQAGDGFNQQPSGFGGQNAAPAAAMGMGAAQGGFNNQNSFASGNAAQSAPQQPAATPNPQGMAMSDAPSDDDIPF